MNRFADFLAGRLATGGFSTEDTLAAFLPLARQVVETHQAALVAPLAGLDALHVAEGRIWFADDAALPPRDNLRAVRDLSQPASRAVEILSEARRAADPHGNDQLIDLQIGRRDEPVTRPVYLPGYVCWEHEVGHHDPLTDVFSLGLLLASLACGVDLNVPEELQSFVAHRDNLFGLRPGLHPVLARAIVRMTELDRHRRPQDLPALVHSLANYRDQPVDLAYDPVLAEGFGRRDLHGRRQLVLGRLRERLFDLSRQNRLLHFRPTAHTVNLTHASVPLSFDVRNIRPDQILTWGDTFAREIVAGEAVSLNKYLNFAEALYLPSALDAIRLEARRDQTEFGFAQLRLVLCFLRWADLKQTPPERYDSPLVLLPIELALKKGVRDTFWAQATTSEAEINPVVRHQFKQLYDVELPETIDLAQTDLQAFFEFLAARVQASEPAVNVKLVERPRIRLIHDRAQRRLDLYRRRQRLAGRGVRSFMDLDYSYDPNNYHPLGLRLFNERIRPPGTRLRVIVEGAARHRHFAIDRKVGQGRLGDRRPTVMCANPAGDDQNDGGPAHASSLGPPYDFAVPASEPEVAPSAPPETKDGLGRPSSEPDEKERLLFVLEEEAETNPYTWEFDLCSVTLGNFRYRKMSLVRDYAALLEKETANAAFDAIFSLSPREVTAEQPPPPLDDRYDVVACDPTQAGAIAQARSGRSYVIQGPPGTGKSQTITNLIADYVAQGRRVLFVCEKRAAIDVVYLRLRQQGLDELCSLIHDSQSDKKEFVMNLKGCYESLLEASGKRKPNRERARENALEAVREHLAPLEHFSEAMCSSPERAAVPLRSVLHRLVELHDRTPSLSPLEQERVPYYSAWLAARPQLKRVADGLSAIQPDGVLAHHPLRDLSVELAKCERPLERASSGLEKATAALAEVETALARTALPADMIDTLEKASELVAYAESVEPLARVGQTALLDAGSPASKKLSKLVKQYRAAETALAKEQAAAAGWVKKLPTADVPIALDQARRLEQVALPFLRLDWWRLWSMLGRSYNFRRNRVRPGWVHVLELLESEYQAAAKVEKLAAQVRQEFGGEESPVELLEAVERLRAEANQASGVVGRLRDRLLKPAAEASEVAALIAARPATDAFRRELATFFADGQRRTFDELQTSFAAMHDALADLPDFLPCLATLAEVPPAVAEAVRELPLDFVQFEAAAAQRSLDDAFRNDRSLARFSVATRDEHANRLDEACREWRKTNAAAVLDRVRRTFFEHVGVASQSAAQLSADEKEFKKAYTAGRRDLEHEFGKSIRFKSIRDLAAGPSGSVIRDLKPVWLMSPLSVSDTLPLDEQLFDVVIFDEASQITVEEAVPAIFRARQAIVVGDEMQLPPTDFFSARTDGDDADRLLVEEGDEVVAYDLDSGSFLNHAVRNLSSRMLGWHYRSRSESLISFSNRAFYQGRLLTVPEERIALPDQNELRVASADDAERFVEPLLARPISFHFLENGLYDNRRNRPEAEYIARLVRELLRRETRLSLGVIAFSEAQQAEITSALNDLARDDADFRRRLEAEYEREDDGQFQGLLVKNLENIQGDERDVVIQSVCYGHGVNGKMLMNFGPINRSGGEKRLNVAFSRAKHHMVLVSSIVAADITNDYNDGALCLKNYLRYAAAVSCGDTATAGRVLADLFDWRGEQSLSSGADDAVVTQLAEALTARGWLVDRSVGQSHFRCDLAIRKSADTAYRLGILIDTDAYYRERDVLERELMKPKLLEAFGWRIAHVLTKDWHADRAGVVARLERATESR